MHKNADTMIIPPSITTVKKEVLVVRPSCSSNSNSDSLIPSNYHNYIYTYILL